MAPGLGLGLGLHKIPYNPALFGAFNPLEIVGLQLYLNKNTNVNTQIAADFVSANSEYLSSTSTDFDFADEDFSICTWVKFDASGASENVLSKWGNSSGKRSYLLQKNTFDNLTFLISSDGTVNTSVGTAPITATNWNFVCVVHDSVNDLIKISLNGDNFVTTSYSGGAYVDASPFRFQFSGAESGGYLNGSQDAPNVFSKALTLAEVKALYNSDNGVDYPSLTDLNGTQYAIGQSFDGSTDAFNIDSVLTPLASTTTGEFEMYVTPTNLTGTQYYLSFAEATSQERIQLRMEQSGKVNVQLVDGGATQWSVITDAIVLASGISAKINIVHNGATPIIKINDIAVAQSFIISTDKTKWFNDIPLVDNGRIGCRNITGSNVGFATATIQNVKIWSDDTQTTLVAHYPMNNVEGTNQLNSESSDSINNSIKLNGSTDALNIDGLITPITGTSTGTLGGWFKLDDGTPTTTMYLIGFGDTNANEALRLFVRTDGYVVADCTIGAVTQWNIRINSQVFTDNTWTHIALMHNGTRPYIFVNGVDGGAADIITTDLTKWADSCTGVDNARLGCSNFNSAGNSAFVGGQMKDIFAYDVNKSSTQILTLYNGGVIENQAPTDTTNLVAYYSMNENNGDRVDSIGGYSASTIGTPLSQTLNTHASLIGTPVSTLASVNNTTISTIESDLVDWWRLNETSGNRSGELGHTLTDNNTVGYALGKVQEQAVQATNVADFVAANTEYLSTSDTSFDKGDEDFSFGCWVKFDNLITTSKAIIGKWGNSSNNKSYTLFYSASANKLIFTMSNDGTNNSGSVQHTDTIVIDTWYFICGVYDSVNDIQKLSINGGNFQTIANSNGAYASSTQEFIIGTNEGGSYLDGQVDSPFFYNKALTFAEVQALYNTSHLQYEELPDLTGNTYAVGQYLDGSTDAFNIDSLLTPLASTTTGYWEAVVTPVDATPTIFNSIVCFGDTNADSFIQMYINTDGTFRAFCKDSGVNQWLISTDAAVFSDGVATKIGVKFNGTTVILFVDDVEYSVSEANATMVISTDTTIFFNDIVGLDNGRISARNKDSIGNEQFFNGTIQNVKIWSDDTQTTQVADYAMNNVEGADQVDSINGYDATLIGTPVSGLASVASDTITDMTADLVAYWELDEESGDRVDSHNPSVDNVIRLDGAADALDITAVLGEIGTTTTGYIEWEATPVTGLAEESPLSFSKAAAPEDALLFIKSSLGKQTVTCKIGGTNQWSITTDNAVFTDGVKTKVAVIQDGVAPKLLIDDIEVAQTIVISTDTTAWFNDILTIDNGRIGCRNGNGGGNRGWFEGDIHYVKIWDSNTQANLVGYWDMNQSTGLSQLDDSGNSNTATLIGSPTVHSLTTLLKDNNTVGYAEFNRLGLVYNWIDQSTNAFIFSQSTFASQPILSENSVDFDGTDDTLNNSTANVFSGDSSGIIFFSGYFDNTNVNYVITSADNAVTTSFLAFGVLTTGELFVQARTGGVTDVIKSTATITNGAYFYGYIKSTGTAYEFNVNSSISTPIVVSGTNRGHFFSDISGRDNLVLGSLQYLTPIYYPDKVNKIIYSNDHTINTTPILRFLSNPDN